MTKSLPKLTEEMWKKPRKAKLKAKKAFGNTKSMYKHLKYLISMIIRRY